MQTVTENTTGTERAVSLRKIAGLGEVYNKGEKQISCFYDYDCVNKLPYRGSFYEGSEVLKRIKEVFNK